MNGIDYNKIKVGDKVYIASSDRRDKPYESIVKSIGRKYITIDRFDSKFDKETGYMKDWSSWSIYPDKETYDNVQKNLEHIQYINRNIDYFMSRYATQDELDYIYDLIKNIKNNE